jgi:hypothetical protein
MGRTRPRPSCSGTASRSSASTRTSDPAAILSSGRKSPPRALALVGRFPTVRTLNLGGGYKVARVAAEKGTDPQVVGAPVKIAFEKFAQADGRRLRLEIEPGTFLVANAGAVLARVQDIVSTGAREFLKLDSGMTEILRPRSTVRSTRCTSIPRRPPARRAPTSSSVTAANLATSSAARPGEPETLATRDLPEARPGDPCVIGGAGAYCAGMSTKNYNSFPEAPEVLLRRDGSVALIRRRQSLEQILQNELPLEGPRPWRWSRRPWAPPCPPRRTRPSSACPRSPTSKATSARIRRRSAMLAVGLPALRPQPPRRRGRRARRRRARPDRRALPARLARRGARVGRRRRGRGEPRSTRSAIGRC